MKNKRKDFQGWRGWRKEEVDESKKRIRRVCACMSACVCTCLCVCTCVHVAFFLALTLKWWMGYIYSQLSKTSAHSPGCCSSMADWSVLYWVVMRGDRVIYLPCRSSLEKPFVFSQMVVNNPMPQVLKDPETIALDSLLTLKHRPIST